jgi:hypothetical protein
MLPGEQTAMQHAYGAALDEHLARYNARVQDLLDSWRAQTAAPPAEAPRPAEAVREPAAAAAPGTLNPETVRAAYDELKSRQFGSAVFISDLAKEAGVPVPDMHRYLVDEATQGRANLDIGHWPSATEEQRAAAVRPGGGGWGNEPHLLVRFPEQAAQAARIAGPAAAPGRVAPPQMLSQRDAKSIVNRAAQQSGLEGRILYAPDERSLPRRIKRDLAATGNSGLAQTVWDNRDGQLWAIGDAFRNASDLHRALIEEAIPRIFDHGQMPITTVHDETDPRLGWWDPVSQRATLNTAQLINRPDPMLDASKTAVHESVVHAGLDRMFANDPDAYNATMDAVRRRFDSTGMSQELAVSRGFEDVGQMTQDYGELYGKGGTELDHAVTEELLATYAEENFPTRSSLTQSPRWYQDALGMLGSAIRREFDWQLSDWDVQHGGTDPCEL